MTRVVLHVGMAKAGSSSLQTAFALRQGATFSYPGDDVASQGIPSRGNAYALYEAARSTPRSDRPSVLASLLDPLLAGASTVVLSSEFLTLSTVDEVADIVAAIRERADLTTVAVVRDVYEHALSAWMHVGRNLPDLTFGDYLARYYAADDASRGRDDSHVLRAEQFTPLMRWADAVGALTVVHLDADPSTLVDRVLAAVGLTVEGAATDPMVVNRGLTYAQFELVRAGARLDPALADLLTGMLGAVPGRRGLPMFGPELDALERRYVHRVDLVNSRWFGGRPVLRVAPAMQRIAPLAELEPDDSTLALVSVVDRLLTAARRRVADHPGRWDDSPARAQGGHPDGFDPARYLLANPDLLVDDVDPWAHWLAAGRHEGRPLDGGTGALGGDR